MVTNAEEHIDHMIKGQAEELPPKWFLSNNIEFWMSEKML